MTGERLFETEGPQPTDTKRCPSCAETVKSEALICRFCGYDFRTGYAAPRATATPAASVAAPHTNGFAIASLVLGILWIYALGSILALVFGYVGKSQIDKSGGTQAGRGLAIAGIVLGWIGVAGTILVVVIAISAVNSVNNL